LCAEVGCGGIFEGAVDFDDFVVGEGEHFVYDGAEGFVGEFGGGGGEEFLLEDGDFGEEGLDLVEGEESDEGFEFAEGDGYLGFVVGVAIFFGILFV
jgi:hypothetical protein